MVGKGVSRTILNEVPFPLFLEGTLGVDVGPGSDGVLVGALTKQAVDKFLAKDGPAYTDETTGANNATANDMHLWPASPDVGDAAVFVQAEKFCEILLTIGTKMVSAVYTAIWEYSKGDGTYGTLTPTLDETSDGTQGPFTVDATGAKRMCFVPPADWAAETVIITPAEGETPAVTTTGYTVRARITAFTSITTVPLGSRVYLTEFKTAVGDGLKLPVKGTVDRATWFVSTLSAANADSKILLLNLTRGTFALVTLTKALTVGEATGLGLGFAIGDELAIKQIAEDGTTEFADVQLYLHLLN